jgi:hypothetical protein
MARARRGLTQHLRELFEIFIYRAGVVKFSSAALAMEIYTRLGIHEQDIVKCAAVLGKVFPRSLLESMNPNHQPLRMATGNKALSYYYYYCYYYYYYY